MNELARHLTEAAGHGHLPFHSACPICREERLAGVLPVRPIVSPRTRAGLAAAVLATSAAPAAALAQAPPVPEGEAEAEGTVEPDPGIPADVEGLDPGAALGADMPLGDEDPLGSGQEDAGPLESGVSEPEPEEGPGPPEADVRGQAESQEAPPVVEDPEPPRDAPRDREARTNGAPREPAAKGRAPALQPPPTAPAPRAPAVAAAAPAAVPATAPAPAGGARFHVVEAGESLWSIARDQLGAGATNAEIAREVQRIWGLNAEAIGTGDPSLVMAGQKLRLP